MAGLLKALIKRNGGNDQGKVTISDTWRVVMSPGDTIGDALTYSGIMLYASHPLYPIARCKSAPWSNPGDESWIFDITYNYDSEGFQSGVSGITASGGDLSDQTPPSDPAETDESQSPEERPWILDYGSVDVATPMQFDAFGTPVINSSRQRIPVSIDRPRRVLKITAFMPISFAAQAQADLYQGAVNSATWGQYPARTVLCSRFEPITERNQDSDFWRIELEFQINPIVTVPVLSGTGTRKIGGWNPQWFANMGTMEWDATNTRWKPIVDTEGRALPPQYLNRKTLARATEAEITGDRGIDNDHIYLSVSGVDDPLASLINIAYFPYAEVDFNNIFVSA